MFGGILQRMIIRELTKVFLLALLGITGILLMAGIVAEATQHGLGPGQILAAIPLLIPSTLPYTIPATTLFATCVVYGRLAADNEILAIKAAGINVTKVVLPGLVLGVVTAGVTSVMYYHLIPYSHRLLREMVFNDAEELIYSLLKKNGEIHHGQDDMYVRAVQGRKLISPTFIRRKPDGQVEVVAQAREAVLRVNLAKKQLLIHMRHGVASSEDGSQAYFDNRVVDIPLPEAMMKRTDRRARDMTYEEIKQNQAELTGEQEDMQAQIRGVEEQLQSPGASPTLADHRNNLQNQLKIIQDKQRFLKVELLMRPALSVGCLFFILVGCPAGIWFSKSDFLSAFITCFLPIVCLYYPLMLSGIGLAKEGKLDPVLMVWGANFLIGGIGLVMLWKLVRN